MKRSAVLLLMAFALPLLFVVRHGEAIEGDPNGLPSPADKKSSPVEGRSSGVELSPPDPVKADQGKSGKDRDGASQVEMKSDVSKERGDKTPETEVSDSKGKGGSDGESDSKAGRAVDSGVEECDPSNRCIDEKNKFVACLRVPGTDSLDLSLLIQNKGTSSLDVNIVAPSFVNPEQATVQLQSKENKQVKVSVRDGANDTVIVLKAGEGNCSLDFRNMISNSIRKSEASTLFGYVRLSTRSSLICIFLAAAALIGVVWLCVRFRRMHRQEGSPGYQKVEMGLPMSSGGKKDAGEADGWDNSWGDTWDDEEAPMTPSNPVLNPSSKGLASRRSNKDGWKE